MLQPHARKIKPRVLTDLLEADIETGFSLVDMAASELCRGNMLFAKQFVQDADRVIADIEQRLLHLDSSECASFLPLLNELRREIEAARNHLPPL